MLQLYKHKGYSKYSLFLYTKEYAFIKWIPYGKTNIHSHNGKLCTMNIIKGPLKEYRYNNKNEINILNSLNKYYIDDTLGKHQVVNPCPTTKWSFHVYL